MVRHFIILILTFFSLSAISQRPTFPLANLEKSDTFGTVIISDSTKTAKWTNQIKWLETDRLFEINGGIKIPEFTAPLLTNYSGGLLYVNNDSLYFRDSNNVDYNLQTIITDLTLLGDGSVTSPLKVDTGVIATVSALRDSLSGIISSVITDETLNGDGSVGSPLSVDTLTYIATKADLTLKQDVLTNPITGTGTTNYLPKFGSSSTIQSSLNIREDVDTMFVDSFLNVDNGTLYVDATNNRVGIGKSSPSYALDVNSTSALATIAYFNTNAGQGVIRVNSNGYGGGVDVLQDGIFRGRLAVSGAFLGDSSTDVGFGSEEGFGILVGGGGGFKFFIESDGDVGIGTSSPTQKLDVVGTVEADGFTINGVPVGTSSSSYWSASGSNIYYNSGNVGIGTSSPLTDLHLKDETYTDITLETSTGNSSILAFATGDGPRLEFDLNTTDNKRRFIIQRQELINPGTYDMIFLAYPFEDNSNFIFESYRAENFYIQNRNPYTGGGDIIFNTGIVDDASTVNTKMTIKRNGDVVISSLGNGSSSQEIGVDLNGKLIPYSGSDERLKQKTNDELNAIAKIKSLNPLYYRWLDFESMGTKEYFGFFAQDIQNVMPSAVYNVGQTDYFGYDKTAIIALNTKAIQEQQAIIEQQSNKITTLESTIQQQSTKIQTLEETIQQLINRIEILENN